MWVIVLYLMVMQPRPILIYVADPLCGWCYGFAPVVEKLKMAYAQQLDWQYLVGGMAVGEHAKPMLEVAAHIRASLQPITERTGAVFSKAFYEKLLSETEAWYDSILPCAAMVYFKNHWKRPVWTDVLAVYHQGIFVDGLAPSSDALLERAAHVAGVPYDGLWEAILAEENQAHLRAEFDASKALNVTAFPGLVLKQTDGTLYPVIEGYASFDRVSALLDRLLAARLSLD